MKYAGTVKDGVVILEISTALSNGTRVNVEPVTPPPGSTQEEHDIQLPSVGERLRRFAGIMKGMPSDMAENHDHYLHGQPKK